MFKILVLKSLYNLSDENTELLIRDRLSFREFLGLTFADTVPDARTIWLFAERLKEENMERYLLRTNITGCSAKDLWKVYIQLTEAEAAFRIEKNDLRIRPIWHQKEERVWTHILVCFLTYVLWKTQGQMIKCAGLGGEPRRILDEIGNISLVDVVLPTKSGTEIKKRCITQPTEHQ
jgi:hypothetical protein